MASSSDHDLFQLIGKPVWWVDLDRTIWNDLLDLLCVDLKANQYLKPSGQAVDWKRLTMRKQFFPVLREIYDFLLQQRSIEDLVARSAASVKLFPEARQFLEMLRARNINTIAVTNNAHQIVEPIIRRLQLPIAHVFANQIRNGRLYSLHSPILGVHKSAVVQVAQQFGVRTVGFAGDSIHDVEAASVAADSGGLILSAGHGALTKWCQHNLRKDQWAHYFYFRTVMRNVAKHLNLLAL